MQLQSFLTLLLWSTANAANFIRFKTLRQIRRSHGPHTLDNCYPSHILGWKVRTAGTVTFLREDGFFLEDRGGIFVNAPVESSLISGLSVGDFINIIGTVTTQDGVTVLTNVSNIIHDEEKSDVALEPLSVTCADIPGDSCNSFAAHYESRLVTIRDVTISDETRPFNLEDGTERFPTFMGVHLFDASTYAEDMDYVGRQLESVTGIARWIASEESYQILPRSAEDIKAYPTPSPTFVGQTAPPTATEPPTIEPSAHPSSAPSIMPTTIADAVDRIVLQVVQIDFGQQVDGGTPAGKNLVTSVTNAVESSMPPGSGAVARTTVVMNEDSTMDLASSLERGEEVTLRDAIESVRCGGIEACTARLDTLRRSRARRLQEGVAFAVELELQKGTDTSYVTDITDESFPAAITGETGGEIIVTNVNDPVTRTHALVSVSVPADSTPEAVNDVRNALSDTESLQGVLTEATLYTATIVENDDENEEESTSSSGSSGLGYGEIAAIVVCGLCGIALVVAVVALGTRTECSPCEESGYIMTKDGGEDESDKFSGVMMTTFS